MLQLTLPNNCSQIELLRALDGVGALRGAWDHLAIEVPNTFVEIPAVAWLCTWGLQQRQRGRRFSVTGHAQSLNLLARYDLFQHLGIPYAESFRRRAAVGRFIPLRLIADGADVKAATDAICDLVLRTLDNAADFLPALEWAVNEIIDNIINHAAATVPGAVCAQLYPNQQRLVVGICDAGQGILNSLAQSHVLADHQEALLLALQRGVTRGLGAGMGNGLADSQEISQLNGGNFQLWSGDALYDLESNGARRIPFTPGTGVAFTLNTDRPVPLADTFMGERGQRKPKKSYLNAEIERLEEKGGLLVADECLNTGTREAALALRRKIIALLTAQDRELASAPTRPHDLTVTLDFAGVKSASSSFLDELLGRLAFYLTADAFYRRIKISNLLPELAIMANVVIAQRLSGVNPAQIRAELESALVRELLGPYHGPDEIIEERDVRSRYLVGMLAPKGQSALPEEMDGLAGGGVDGQDGITEAPPSRAAASMLPRSIGLSFAVNGGATHLQLNARWGRYQRHASDRFVDKEGKPRAVWQRSQVAAISPPIPLSDRRMENWQPDPVHQPDVYVQGLIRRRDHQWHVTLFLVNGQQEQRNPKLGADSAWLFQPELSVEAPDGAPIFEKRRVFGDATDHEAALLAFLYRDHLEFAIGHGVAVHTTLLQEQSDRAVRLTTRVLPIYEVPQTTPPTPTEISLLAGLTLDMKQLAQIANGHFGPTLAPLATAYAAWIDDLRQRLAGGDPDLLPHSAAAQNAIDHCAATLDRMRQGIALLDQDQHAAAAFRFANEAMYRQRIQAAYAKTVRQGQSPDWAVIDKAENHSWRTFQLAFLLLNLPALVDPTHPDRNGLVDLIWFPTGGGKTEAYLGVAACALALRRLQPHLGGRNSQAGVGVLMRYTLRLLTLQQFQRAAALICACEVIRRENPAQWGHEPFRIGLWVGGNTTPNRTQDADEAIKSTRQNGRPGGKGSPHQLTNCPWCGRPIDPGRDIDVEPFEAGRGRTLVYCSDNKSRCPFGRGQAKGEGLPILTVDEEIYRLLPALLIATVDKFAQMPWNGRTAMLFGQVNGYCERHGFRSPELADSDSHPPSKKYTLPAARTLPMAPLRPPDLIIQDELHLISGPLGSLVGLYETAVDQLCTWSLDGQPVRPKVIAATATIRQAGRQVHGLFQRQVNIFPPQALDVGDSFFSRQRPTGDGPEALPGRRYIGINAPGIRHKTALIRTYTSLLSAAQALYEKYGAAADPWMTLVGYFNSLRELGSMRRAVDDSVAARLRRMNERGQTRRTLTPYSVEELTSRLSATDIPDKLDQLEQKFDPDGGKSGPGGSPATPGGAPRRLRPIDVLLATNMISVGVDIDRLGLMVCAGQPKTTAEYIQASSRVGRNRSGPGLVCVVYNWTRPRDLSHYEAFEHYHATFYQQVEALSVTPFSVGAMKRGLSALLVAQARLADLTFNPNQGAERFRPDHPTIVAALAAISQRAAAIAGPAIEPLIWDALAVRLTEWADQLRTRVGVRVGYEQQGDTYGLLTKPEGMPWGIFTCLNSLRDVEPTVKLVLDDKSMDRGEQLPWLANGQAGQTEEE
jgi:hypothetical protein